MKNLEIAKKLVTVRATAPATEFVECKNCYQKPGSPTLCVECLIQRDGGFAIYAPGLPGLRRLEETHYSREYANVRAKRIVEHVAAILDAADRVRFEQSKGTPNGAKLVAICTEAAAGKLNAVQIHERMVPLIVSALVSGEKTALQKAGA